MKKTILLMLVAVLFSPSLTEASRWQLIKLISENSGCYVDMSNIKRVSKNKIRFWYTFAKSPEDAKKDNGIRNYLEMDCQKKRYRDVKWEREDNSQSYSGNGVSVEVSSSSTIIWDNISPDSLQESFHEALCRKKR